MGAGVVKKGGGGGRRGRRRGSSAAMADINITPFVDVMLVLLIIFIITVPVIRHAVQLELPQAASTPITMPTKAPPPPSDAAKNPAPTSANTIAINL